MACQEEFCIKCKIILTGGYSYGTLPCTGSTLKVRGRRYISPSALTLEPRAPQTHCDRRCSVEHHVSPGNSEQRVTRSRGPQPPGADDADSAARRGRRGGAAAGPAARQVFDRAEPSLIFLVRCCEGVRQVVGDVPRSCPISGGEA